MPENSSQLHSFLAALPKVELHVHLEGSLSPDTLRELAKGKWLRKRKIEKWIAAREASNYLYGDFAGFIDGFKDVVLLLETPEDYALATTRLIESLAAQNIRYAEITLSAGVVLWKKQSLEEVMAAVSAAANDAGARLGVHVQWIPDAIRQLGAKHARQVLEKVIRLKHLGVAAFGIGGDEAGGPAKDFQEVFREAREAGLHVTAHAGESCGPESIRQAVELLGAERIGHGLTAAQDENVMALLRERQIPVEVCLSSNVSTGVLARLQDHPLRKFLEQGMVVTLNTDDPAMFGTNLVREFEIAAETFSLDRAQLTGLLLNAANAAFLPETDRQNLVAAIQAAAGREI